MNQIIMMAGLEKNVVSEEPCGHDEGTSVCLGCGGGYQCFKCSYGENCSCYYGD